jgi:two-component system, cell cycle sensor histidine kinase and response regulator CckA
MASITTEPIHVLVVDDDSQLLRTLSDILNHKGYSPHTAVNAVEGLALARQAPAPAVALVDLKLPDMDGLELVSRLREISSLTETVILTGNASVDTAVRALREQSHDYLLKPVAPDQLLGVLSRASERWRRRNVEETLRQTEERSHLLLESISDVVAVVNEEGLLEFATVSLEKQLGYLLDEVTGQSCIQWLHEQDAEKLATFLKTQIAAPGATGAIELRVRHRDDTWRTLACQVTNLRDRTAIKGFLVTARDVTDAYQLERQFRQAQKMEVVGNLAGGIAHDFNNVLTAVLGYSELVLSHDQLPASLRADVDEIRLAGQRAARLTRQLLSFSRQQPTEPKVVNIEPVLAELTRMLQRLIGEQIVLEIRHELDVAPMLVDPTQLEQVVTNLVVNARDAVGDGGTITLETANVTVITAVNAGPAPGEYVRLTVRDNGCGMTEEVRARVFEPFFTTKEPGKGTGLGLSTCYGIVQQANGGILIDSEVGRGTTIHTYWPRATAGLSENGGDTVEPRQVGGNERILVVDDDDGVRRLAAAILTRHGYRVDAVASAEEALEVLDALETRPHLVLSDVVLTGISGWQLASLLLDVHPGTRVLLMSGYDKPPVGEAQPIPALGAPLAKPFSAADLTSRVRHVLDASTGQVA